MDTGHLTVGMAWNDSEKDNILVNIIKLHLHAQKRISLMGLIYQKNKCTLFNYHHIINNSPWLISKLNWTIQWKYKIMVETEFTLGISWLNKSGLFPRRMKTCKNDISLNWYFVCFFKFRKKN